MANLEDDDDDDDGNDGDDDDMHLISRRGSERVSSTPHDISLFLLILQLLDVQLSPLHQMEIKLVVLIHSPNTMAQPVVSFAMLVTFLLDHQGGSAWKTRLGVDSQRPVKVRNLLTFLQLKKGAVIYKAVLHILNPEETTGHLRRSAPANVARSTKQLWELV